NQDPTQFVHSFVVDGVPPVLTVTQAPPDVLGAGDQPLVYWSATDDRTPADQIQSRWELRRVADGGARGEVVAQADFAAGVGTLVVPELDGDSLYVLQIVVRDQAGNLSSAEYPLVVDPGSGGGCSAGGTGAHMWAVLVALAVLVLLRRRALGLMIIVAVAIAAPAAARAQGVGTTMSGPTDGDGAAAFWNPAAMARGADTQVELGTGLSFIRVDYQPMTGDGSHTFVPKPEPTVGVATDLGSRRWRAGITVGVPQIDGATWARDDGAGDITRWYATEARAYNVDITPAVAFAPRPWVAFGAGIDIVRSRIECQMDKDMGKQLNLTAGSPYPDSPFPYADPDLAAPLQLEATGWSVGAVAGVLLRPHDRVTFGASVHAPTTARDHGDVHVTYPEAMQSFLDEAAPAAELPPLEGKIAVDSTQPLMAFAALAVEPADRWELRADYRYLDRSASSNLHFDVQEATSEDVRDTLVARGYHDRHSLGLRASHAFLEGRGLGALRARWEPNSIPESTLAPNNLDFDKVELGAALRFWISRRAAVLGQYSHYLLRGRTVDQSLHQPLAERELDAFNHPSPTGDYSAAADYVAFVLSVVM
ncbi:MAG TPA: outer membrane protein transport protein, partial [Kofleriaceae bacterium]|nr:outer membrane protein transport protein [Kofleriaceae bacterium]